MKAATTHDDFTFEVVAAHDSVHAKKGLALLHDEYVVKSGQQIDIKEIIIVHKEEK